jgi:ABC-type glycerol-3-phosphate transport system substrate-binding protein
MKKLAFLLAAGLLGLAGCTVKKDRAPGPLLVWIASEDDAELMELRMMAEAFRKQTKIQLELVTKSSYDMQFTLLRHPEDLVGVDVVEVDYFDLPQLADRMTNIKKVFDKLDGLGRLNKVAFSAGIVGGNQKFIPWRLSWPALAATSDYAHPGSFGALAEQAETDELTVMFPALEDRDLYALLCAVAWSVQADPTEPGPAMASAMDLYARLAKVVPMDASAASPGDAAAKSSRPDIIFDWPHGLLALGTAIPLDLESTPLPCGGGTNCVPFFGRYLASPNDAPHPDDAIQFIQFMISARVQTRLATNTEWLPVRTDGFADLAGRQDAYQGISDEASMLRALPQSEKTRKALVAAGRLILFEGATAEQGMEEFRSRTQ